MPERGHFSIYVLVNFREDFLAQHAMQRVVHGVGLRHPAASSAASSSSRRFCPSRSTTLLTAVALGLRHACSESVLHQCDTSSFSRATGASPAARRVGSSRARRAARPPPPRCGLRRHQCRRGETSPPIAGRQAAQPVLQVQTALACPTSTCRRLRGARDLFDRLKGHEDIFIPAARAPACPASGAPATPRPTPITSPRPPVGPHAVARL